jgi:hypothetical protein
MASQRVDEAHVRDQPATIVLLGHDQLEDRLLPLVEARQLLGSLRLALVLDALRLGLRGALQRNLVAVVAAAALARRARRRRRGLGRLGERVRKRL